MNNRSFLYIMIIAINAYGMVHADSAPSVKVTEKVGYIDAFQVMRESEEGKLAAKELEQKKEALSSELQKEYQTLTQADNDYKAKASMLNDVARSKEEEKLVKMKRTLENKAKESEEEMQIAMQRTTERLAKKVRETAEQIAHDLKLDVVIDIMTGQVLYVSQRVNYTTEALKKMDNEYKLAKNTKVPKKEIVASNKKATAPAA